jgi:hypothetical protein
VHEVVDELNCAPLTISREGPVAKVAVPPQLFTTVEYVPTGSTGRTSVKPNAPQVPGGVVFVKVKVSVLM